METEKREPREWKIIASRHGFETIMAVDELSKLPIMLQGQAVLVQGPQITPEDSLIVLREVVQ